uniref:Uncharacterized protein LOC104214824 n=1 Tax=Nicotiana sylvestris TaxID=4096 RepID=A0A1U7VLX6_NICSY|nr:PREDICTED: uncharacterized protein LOC104214824 [Nicotiana sylvestris]
MPNDKAPGVDGFPIEFFKRQWEEVRQDILRIKTVIEGIIGKAQSAFIEGTSIVDNILFSHELFNGSNKNGLSPRCMLKVDLRKAYDFLDWGDTQSITIMQETFKMFSNASGLQASAEKSSIYIAGVAQHIKEQLIECTGYDKGSIPFKYLGVPLSARKLNIHQYLALIEKITERVRCWSAMMLSYSGRVQLIKSVLIGIQTKELIAWDRICQPKATGGLNLINMKIWNKAALLKHLWALAMTKDTLWIKWAHIYYIKNRPIDEVNTPKIVAWVVRKIIEAKGEVQKLRSVQTTSLTHWTTL